MNYAYIDEPTKLDFEDIKGKIVQWATNTMKFEVVEDNYFGREDVLKVKCENNNYYSHSKKDHLNKLDNDLADNRIVAEYIRFNYESLDCN